MIDLFPVKKNYGMAKKPGLWPLFAKLKGSKYFTTYSLKQWNFYLNGDFISYG